ncbi:hypothetical protein BFP71_14190 [Roseivirga misakiensis]|uniref:Tail specific protease domain-containing protein n=2 Tax=Roseivirga misakiensis TaxID=1563681 RepID=A0A1E5SZS4_9BACT|nr:hypothetical protein BFP71_14190 [Roseivirga misakiensis]
MVDDMSKTIAKLIEDNYVLEEKGYEIADYFLKNLRAGRFYQAKTLKQLDSIMTKTLRESSNDYHLYTWNNKKIVEQLKVNSEEIEAEEEVTNFFNDSDAYNANFGFEKVDVLSGNIGYIKLNQINISDRSLKKLYASMALVEHTDALIIDLRNNGGGGSTIGSVLETYFLEGYKPLLEFRSRNGKPKIEYTVGWLLENRYLKPLYVLVNKGTASAAEAFVFALKSHNRCIAIGQPTSGGAFMNTYFPVNEDFIIAISTSAPFLPDTNTSWEGKGVQPDYLTKEEDALSKAIELIRNR